MANLGRDPPDESAASGTLRRRAAFQLPAPIRIQWAIRTACATAALPQIPCAPGRPPAQPAASVLRVRKSLLPLAHGRLAVPAPRCRRQALPQPFLVRRSRYPITCHLLPARAERAGPPFH